jgi:hypothetical protein
MAIRHACRPRCEYIGLCREVGDAVRCALAIGLMEHLPMMADKIQSQKVQKWRLRHSGLDPESIRMSWLIGEHFKILTKRHESACARFFAY